MAHHEHHQELLRDVSDEFKEILDGSDQAIYIYLDDIHKVCNQNFADLLGYASPAEWAAVTEPFPQVFVSESSQHALIDAFQKAMERKSGSTIQINWKKKNGETADTTVILVPMSYKQHLFALHFVSPNN